MFQLMEEALDLVATSFPRIQRVSAFLYCP